MVDALGSETQASVAGKRLPRNAGPEDLRLDNMLAAKYAPVMIGQVPVLHGMLNG